MRRASSCKNLIFLTGASFSRVVMRGCMIGYEDILIKSWELMVK